MSGAHSRRLNLIAFVVLLVALAAGTGLRVHAQRENPNVQHDEAWSYASAAGRLGPFLAAMDGAASPAAGCRPPSGSASGRPRASAT